MYMSEKKPYELSEIHKKLENLWKRANFTTVQ